MIQYHVIGSPAPMERNDCMIRALANALNKPYYEVHQMVSKLGRRRRCGTKWPVCVKAMLEYKVGIASPIQRRITHAQFIASHPKGKFIVMSKTHAWALKDGIVFDAWKPGPRKQIQCIGVVA